MTGLYDSEEGDRRSPARSTGAFIEECRAAMRVRRLSLRTEQSYLYYIHRFIRFHRRRPETMGSAEVEAYLTHLVLHENVAPATQNVAFNALLSLYRNILEVDLGGIAAVRAHPVRLVPQVLARRGDALGVGSA